MNVLAIDTSQPRGSVSIRAGGRGESVALESASSHLTELAGAVSALLSRSGIGFGAIDRVAIVSGPGSFTGLRVGMAYMKGLYAARPFEVVAMTSLELLARQAAAAGEAVSPMIDARKNEVYAALYDAPPAAGDAPGDGEAPPPLGLVQRIAPCVVAPRRHIESIGRRATVFVGSGALKYRADIESAFGEAARFAEEGGHAPDTALLCRLAENLTPIPGEHVATLEPFYVRPDDVTLKPLKGVCAYDRS